MRCLYEDEGCTTYHVKSKTGSFLTHSAFFYQNPNSKLECVEHAEETSPLIGRTAEVGPLFNCAVATEIERRSLRRRSEPEQVILHHFKAAWEWFLNC